MEYMLGRLQGGLLKEATKLLVRYYLGEELPGTLIGMNVMD
jgi:hypothetical protein